MNYRILFVVNALIAVLLGLGFVVVPSRLLDQFGMDGYAATKLAAQFVGVAVLALGLLLWFAKDVTEENLQKGMAIALLVSAVAGLFITLVGINAGVLRSNGWIAMLICVVFGCAYAYLAFLRPRVEAA